MCSGKDWDGTGGRWRVQCRVLAAPESTPVATAEGYTSAWFFAVSGKYG